MLIEITLEENLGISEKKLIALNIFWWGFIIYTSAYVIKINPQVSLKIPELIQLIGSLCFISAGVYLLQFRIKNKYLKVLFSIYYISLITVIFRGIHLNYDSVKTMLIDANYGIVIYLAPLIILFPPKIIFYKKLFDVIVILGIIFLLFSVVFIRELLNRSEDTQEVIEYFAKFLSVPCGFILLTYKYHSKTRKLLSLSVMLLTLLFAIYKARRGLSLICASSLIGAYFLYLFNTRKTILVIYFSVLLAILGIYKMSTIYNIHNNGLLSFIAKRGEEDTRTPVELYYYSDMKQNDWIFGRGINGQYYCPDIGENQLTDYRSYIETGYLQIILKGGIINLSLYLLILIPALFLGLFNSKNLLTKASAIWILISLISLYPSTVNTFSLNFLLVWISVSICCSKKIRMFSDYELKELLSEQFLKKELL